MIRCWPRAPDMIQLEKHCAISYLSLKESCTNQTFDLWAGKE